MAEVDEQIESVPNAESASRSNSTSENGIQTSNKETEISQNPKENTRRIIASLYVWAFFIIIFVCLLIGLLENYTVDNYKDMLITVSGVLSGPLGFIVGYYFKASTE